MASITQISRAASVLLLLAGVCAAQQDVPAKGNDKDSVKTDTSMQPMRPYPAATQGPSSDLEVPEKVPDTRPLSGVLGLTLGSLKGRQNIISLDFGVRQVFDSNPGVLGTGSDYQGATALRGDLSLIHPMRRGDLTLDYHAGAVFYNDRTATSWFPQLRFSVPFALRRWTIVLAEDFSYTPENSGAGLGFSDFGASAQGGITSNFTPQQSVYTPVASRLSSTTAAQVQYGFSARSSWTAAVTYGKLYFPDGILQNTEQIVLRSGYNRNLSARDTVAIFYDYGIYKVEGISGSTNTHAAQVAYGRRVTGRLSFSVSGGPQILIPLLSAEKIVSWTASTAAQYELRRWAANLSYTHGATAGGGVYPGARSDGLQLGFTRQLTRNLSVGASGSLSKTASLERGSEFRSGGAGVQVDRQLGQRARMHFTYGFQRQISDGACSGVLCGGLSRHVFGVGFGWGPRPWVIR